MQKVQISCLPLRVADRDEVRASKRLAGSADTIAIDTRTKQEQKWI